MSAAPSRSARHTLRHELFAVGSSVFMGVAFSGFYAVSRPKLAGRIVLMGAITGLTIYLVISLLQYLLAPRIERLPARFRTAAHSVLFLVGGAFGWFLGMGTSAELFAVGFTLSELLSRQGAMMMAPVAVMSVAIGLGFYTLELLKERLQRATAQLKEREWAEKELELARKIQTRLLPPPRIEGDGFRIEARNLAAHFVAGDFFDVVRLEDGSVVIVVADVAGKGLGASLIMASVKAVLPFVAREEAPRAMSMLNEKLLGELSRREFVALSYARYYPADGRVDLLNAGFPDPYLIGREGVRPLVAGGTRLPLGIRRDVAYDTLTAQLAPGDKLLFVSDGLPEAPSHGDPLGYDRLAALVAAPHADPWLDTFLGTVRAAVDEVLEDDWTAVVLTRL